MTTARRTASGGLIKTVATKPLEPLKPGQARCAGCSRAVALTRNGKLCAHRDSRGDDCAYTTHVSDVQLDELPPVVLPKPRGRTRNTERRPTNEPSRLDVGSNCRECGKWLPGERYLCGACYAKKGR